MRPGFSTGGMFFFLQFYQPNRGFTKPVEWTVPFFDPPSVFFFTKNLIDYLCVPFEFPFSQGVCFGGSWIELGILSGGFKNVFKVKK